jgi:MoxR-like ATPase
MNILKKIESSLATILAGALVLAGVQPAAARSLGRAATAGKATVAGPAATLAGPGAAAAAMSLGGVGSLSVQSNLPAGMNAVLPTAGNTAAPALRLDSPLQTAIAPSLSSFEAVPTRSVAAPAANSAPTAAPAKALASGGKAVANDTKALGAELANMPEIGKVSVADAYGSGAAIEAAMTRTRVRQGGAFAVKLQPTLSGNLNSASGLQRSDYASANRSRAAAKAIAAPIGRVQALDSWIASPKGMLMVGAAAIATLLAFQLWMPAILSSLGMLGMTGMVRRGDEEKSAGESSERFLTGRSAGPAQGVNDNPEFEAEVAQVSELLTRVKGEVAKVIVGQEEMVDSILIALIAREHVSLEGLPGVAKTATVSTIADALGANFSRIQGTPDKEPSDILGAEILQEQPSEDGQSVVRKLVHEKGPVFANLLLVDEINRMQTKTQSALLEVMQERQVTIGKVTEKLPKPFVLLATQNPIEQEGTYPLAEAQEDRFMFKTIVPQPNAEERREINRRMRLENKPKAQAVGTIDEFAAVTGIAERVSMDEAVSDYIQRVLDTAVDPFAAGIGKKGLVETTLVTRASILFEKSARIHAVMQGRTYATYEDVRAVAHRILRHRIKLSWAAGDDYTTDMLIDEVLATVPIRR